jgi:hypothetical protein
MVGPWPYRAYTLRPLSKTYGQMWVRCDVCRRYARLKLAGLHDVDYRTKPSAARYAAAHLMKAEVGAESRNKRGPSWVAGQGGGTAVSAQATGGA